MAVTQHKDRVCVVRECCENFAILTLVTMVGDGDGRGRKIGANSLLHTRITIRYGQKQRDGERCRGRVKGSVRKHKSIPHGVIFSYDGRWRAVHRLTTSQSSEKPQHARIHSHQRSSSKWQTAFLAI